jgi:hypothetical protein
MKPKSLGRRKSLLALSCVSLAVGLMFCTVSAMKTPLDDGVSAKQAVSSSGSFRPASSFLSRKVSSAAGSSKPVPSSAVSSAAAVSSKATVSSKAAVSSAAASSAKPAPLLLSVRHRHHLQNPLKIPTLRKRRFTRPRCRRVERYILLLTTARLR